MAAAASTPAQTPETKLTQQAVKLIAEAKQDRDFQLPWHRDFYRYFKPWAKRPNDWKQRNDQDDLFDSTAIESLADFAADMQTTLTPPEDDWLDVEPSESIPNYTAGQLEAPLKDFQNKLFSEVRRSNFHEASLESYSDLGGGTMGMVIQDFDLNAPIQCQSAPISDLLIIRGVFGGVDFRCRVIGQMKLRDVPATYPKANLSKDLQQRIKDSPGAETCVHECFWRLWDVKGVERWQFVLLIENKFAQGEIMEGEGCCPLIVARWRTDSTTAWGFGAAYVVLPIVKTLDQLNYLIMKHLSFVVDPAAFYDDDGTINLDNGLTPGDFIPRAAGSKIDVFESEADFNTAFFERKDMQSEIKRALFQDKPQQSGDTPPTASQWMDQKAEIARRMGAPFGRLTTEWQIAVFQRFAYLLAKRGVLQDVKLNGKVVHLRAQSPIIKAQRQQKVMVAERLLQAMNANFGQEMTPLVVDEIKTAKNMQDALGDTIVVLRNDADISGILQKAALVAQQAGMLPGQGSADQQQPAQQAAA